ncbi:hypothetical protein [Streptomyces sp. NBC_01190]|uniref:hypothetical protein n=1 Tax=Streptomyces sp. NBC_01190 TaxID=2903767 RepID=UPI003868DC3D|nr:hypothetical protein OG519_08345 [Streptomyces sp. NBC_01190]
MASVSLDPTDPTLQRLNALRLMMMHCLLEDQYSFPAALDQAITLSETGKEWYDRITAEVPGLSASDAKAALFAEIVIGKELTFSIEGTDFELLRQAIAEDVKNRRIRYPWVFGRDLDDAYLRVYGNEPRSFLSNEESVALLNGVPQGVFQIADVTVGPLGILVVPEYRCLLPTTCGPAIECLDPGCSGVHHSRLSTGSTPSGKAYQAILPDFPVDIALGRLVADLARPDDEFFRTDNRWGLPWLLTNGMSEAERVVLFTALVKENRDGIREFVGRHLGAELARRPAREIADAVAGAELFQLLLAVSDTSLVLKLEEAISDGRIVVGRTEVRRPIRPKHEDGGAFRAEAQASRLGVRFSSSQRLTAPVALKHLITSLYTGEAREDLDWRLRTVPGNDAIARLDHFLQRTAPREVVSRLILDNRSALLSAFSSLRYGKFQVPRTPQEESELIDRILWKLGYPLDAPESTDAAVRKYARQMLQVSEGRTPPDSRVDEIRSAGTNLFAALEDLLGGTLRFVCWVLLGDPYPDEHHRRFVFRRAWAEKFLTETMTAPEGLPDRFVYDAEGRNSLGVLIKSFRVLATKCELVLEKPDAFLRSPDRVPFFSARASSIYIFPFLHSRLILDLSDDSRQVLLTALRDFAATLENGRVVDVRNRVVHPADDFPSAAEITAACAMIERGLDLLTEHGLLPAIYMWAGESTDSFRRKVTRMTDGAARSVELVSPSELDECGMPNYDRPQMIPIGARLAQTGEPIRLRFEEETEFTALWEDYLAYAWRARDLQELAQPEPASL